MQTSVLKKEDLLQKLIEMDSQLQRLDETIVSAISHQTQQWEKEQEARLDSCVSQLKTLERKMTVNEASTDDQSTSFRLKLSS